MKLNWHVSIRTIRELLNRNNISNQISLFNVSKNDLFTGLMRYYVCCKFLNDFLFRNEIAIPQQEFMFLKFEKVHLESCLRYRETTLRYLGFQTSLNLCISFFFRSTAVERFFWKILFLKISAFFSRCFFFPQCLRKMFYSNCTFTVCNFTKSWST